MNGGRHRGPMDIDGCLSAIGWGVVWFFGLAVFLMSLAWFFSSPPDVCQTWDTTKVIEKNQAQQEILVDKKVCTKYVPSTVPSPFIRIIHWAGDQIP